MFDKSQLPDITEREQAFELHKTYEAACDAVIELEQTDCDPEALRLAVAKSDEAQEAYEDCGIVLLTDAMGNAVRCAMSGAPILESDEAELVLGVAIEAKQLLPDMEEVA